MLTVREFARLTIDEVNTSSDMATIPSSAFEWLCRHGSGTAGTPALVKMEGTRTLKLRNYVGVIETPCGTQIEILPKHIDSRGDFGPARRLLITMISEAINLKPRVASGAMIEAFNLPMTEWLAAEFLGEVLEITKRGPRQDYHAVEVREPFLRGRLDVSRQIRAAGSGGHLLHIRHDEFSLDRAENRLIRSTIEHIARRTTSNDNWRLARELSILLSEIPESRDVHADLRRWRRDRHLADYTRIRPLCELLLTHRLPLSVVGGFRGFSMLFPMERLFERYVLRSLQTSLPAHFEVKAQDGAFHLCTHEGNDWFKMKPDIIIINGARRWIVDAKWKRLSSDRDHNYELSQADFYQLFAYGQKYLDGVGDMFLVYPAVRGFPNLNQPFKLTESLRLHVLPFDMVTRHAAYSFMPSP